jgi:hypothetical protein
MSKIVRWFKIQGEVDKFFWKSYKVKAIWVPLLSIWVLSFILVAITSQRFFFFLGNLSFTMGLSVMITDLFWVKATKREEFKKIKLGETL